ncbi:MAG: alpha/beta fold hydrolase [Alphaproteobacteria bacterium]|nr:alpha/beta fold hydrolase [Alphaproteobacteria bacterium]
MPSPLRRLAGHAQTVLPALLARARPPTVPASTPWHTTVDDPRTGRLQLHGRLTTTDRSDVLVVIVHGIGASSDAPYCRLAAAAAHALGLSSLRVDLRGADRTGAGIYHAGLTDDLDAVLADPVVGGFRAVVVLGYSLGGHVTLRTATHALPDNVRAVAAVCAPLHLDAAATWIDTPRRLPYRRHLLTGLREIHARVAAVRSDILPVADAARIHTLRAWDDRVVAPWFGFASAEDYYARASVGPRLDALTVPALAVHVDADPIVGPAAGVPGLRHVPDALTAVRIDRGGHVVLPPDADLGLGTGAGDTAVLRWLLARAG